MLTPTQQPYVEPQHWKKMVLSDYSPLLRALLTTDGTLTTLISAFTQQSVIAQPISTNPWIFQQAFDLFSQINHTSINSLTSRSTHLILSSTQQIFAETYAVIALDAFPSTFLAHLQHTPAGIGQTLQQQRTEHFRHLFWYGLIPRTQLQQHPQYTQLPDYLPARSYGIFIEKKLTMLIAECFCNIYD